jgi:phytoene dehydrogenase-like protein
VAASGLPSPGTDADLAAEVIVVGGGHNGLIAATYLARAGLDTVLVEARTDVGGCAATVTDLGARFNICNCDHTMIRAMPFMDHLDLAAHGLEYLESEVSMIHAYHDGSDPWVFLHDTEAHLDALGTTHPHWVPVYRRYLDDALDVARLIIENARRPPTRRTIVANVMRRRGRGTARLLEWSRMSASSVLARYSDDWRLWMPAISTGPTVWGVHPDTPGTGLAAALYAVRHLVRTGRPVGGSGALTDALWRSFSAAGGRTITGVRVIGLDTGAGAVRGVRLDNGCRLVAGRVLAACDPQRVFHDWLGDDSVGRADAEVARWRSMPVHDGYESKIDAVLSALPEPLHVGRLRSALPGLAGADLLGPTAVISPSPEDLAEAHRLRASGTVAARPTMLLNIPTTVDEAMMTVPGEHVLSLEVLFTPYAHDWSVSGEPQRWLDILEGLCEPGSLRIDRWRAMTPDRYESEFSMHRGHTPAFAGSPLDTFLARPPELTRHRSSLAGLYLSGAATFPGAGVFGAAGRNAAAAVAGDLGIDLPG